ncbi:MAG TPA: trypsin-like peptidase domain-containing protein [Chloroflexota bacterium]|nr:trypsin-like peptidase domain-containing protein [Chloroflexota bacterium]
MADAPSTYVVPGDSGVEAIAQRLFQSTVRIRAGRHGMGSGIVWQNGTIVTNAHVAVRDRLEVEGFDGGRFGAEVRERRPQHDLACLSIPPGRLPVAAIGDSTALRPGELVLALGNPLGLSNAVAMGVIHRSDSKPTTDGAARAVQADIRLAPGYSGGPLLNARGEVVGVNSMVAGGLGIAVAATEVNAFLQEAGRPKLGVRLQQVTLEPGSNTSAGLLVLEVRGSSPASEAGLIVGDILLRANGRPLAQASNLQPLLGDADVVLSILRGGRIIERTVRLASGDAETGRAA